MCEPRKELASPLPSTLIERRARSARTGGQTDRDDEVLVEAPTPVPGLLFVRVPEAKTVKNRVHFDWEPVDRSRDEEVERVIGLGASLYEDHRGPQGRGWVTLLDPEGNEFCIEREAQPAAE